MEIIIVCFGQNLYLLPKLTNNTQNRIILKQNIHIGNELDSNNLNVFTNEIIINKAQ